MLTNVAGQQLYRYQDETGGVVYADRPPADSNRPAETLQLEFEVPESRLRVFTRQEQAQLVVVADNEAYAPVQLAFRLTQADNVAGSEQGPIRGNYLLAARTAADILTLQPGSASTPMHFNIVVEHIFGRPGARHQPPQPYRVPFARSNHFPVSQAFPDQVTHTDRSSWHAIDFVMPIGTPVYAAREGTVVEIAAGNFSGGLDPQSDLARANIVRILHSDGTLALYAHLNWNSIRVRPGDQVTRGEYIADSGNTGFSSGPHLHFVVQRNAGGFIESVPVSFVGAGGAAVTLTSGVEATAY